jgi:hypothetical protein
VAIPNGVAVGIAVYLLNPGPVIALALGIAVGWATMNVRLWVWKRRHPIITPQQWLDERRRAAPFN